MNKLKISIWLLILFLGFSAVSAISFTPKKNNDTLFYFDKEPYINPKIIEDLTTWLSDTGNQIVSIDLQAQNSNRFSCDIKTKNIKGENPYIFLEEDGEYFGYKLIGKTDSDIYVIKTYSGGSGTGVFEELMFIKLEKENFLSYDKEQASIDLNSERFIIKKLGCIPLGDRYEGEIKIKGNNLFISKDKNNFSGVFTKDTVIQMDFKQ
jgi:hypothetical protein